MKISKKMIGRVIALSLIFSTTFTVFNVEAADKKKEHDTSSMPIVVEADELSFSDLNGDVFAKGKVVITQQNDKLTGDLLRGNTKQTQLWIDGNATYLEPESKTNLTGTQTQYNYQDHTGTMAEVSGTIGRGIVNGHQIELMPDEYIIHNGTMTACPAKVPDYHVSASKIEIWPGDKMIAYDAKFWIKNTVIYSMPKYQRSLKEGVGESEFPRIGYDNDDGFTIRQHLEYPLTQNMAAFANLNYYSQKGLKPNAGIINTTPNFETHLIEGYYRDDDNGWIKKTPELRVDYFAHRLGSLPISYKAYALYGKWSDKDKSSWHQEYNIYFSHDRILLDSEKTLTLNLGAGFKSTHESYDNLVVNSYRWDAKLNKEWSPKLDTWTAYHYIEKNVSLFDFETPDLGRQLDVGLSYKIDKMNRLTYVQTYDMENQRIHDQDYTWQRNLHCWQADITYRAKRHEIKMEVSLARW